MACGAVGSWAVAVLARTPSRPRTQSATPHPALCDLCLLCDLGISLLRHRFLLFVIELQRKLEVGRLVAREVHRVDARVAGTAVRATAAANGGQHAVEAQVANRIAFEKVTDLVEAVRRGDQLLLARRIHSIEAG